MAIKKTIIVNGVTIPNCYIKIATIGGTAHRMSYTIELKATRESHCFNFDQFSFTPDLEGLNFIKQAYNHLKTQSFYADSLDD